MQPEKFLASLSDALHDADLEDAKKIPMLFWDTSHVRSALLGQADYYQVEITDGHRRETFLKDRFNGEAALVHALMSDGWFGDIRLLQPHQAELLRLINQEFDLGTRTIPSNGIRKFLHDTRFRGLDEKELEEGVIPSRERVAELVQLHVGEAPKLFKITQAGKYQTWTDRLNAWGEKGAISLDRALYDYDNIISHPVFQKAEEGFAEERPDKDSNNFADAVALCQLHLKVEEFKAGASEIPRMLCPKLFFSVIENRGLWDYFSYKFQGEQHHIFRDIEYFKLRATLTKPPGTEAETVTAKRHQLILQVRSQLGELRAARRPLGKELGNFEQLNRQTMGLLTEVEQYSFLEDVWLRSSGSKEAVTSALQQYVEVAKLLRGSGASLFRAEMNLKSKQFISDLTQTAQKYSRLGQGWHELREAIDKQRKILYSNQTRKNIVAVSGVLRFGFPADKQARIGSLLDHLTSEDGRQRTEATLEVLKDLSLEDGAELDLTISAGVMWGLGLFEHVFEILKRIGPADHFSLRILAAASALKIGQLLPAKSLISQLEKEYQTTTEQERPARAVGLGYLLFHYREAFNASQLRLNQKEGDELLARAVELAKVARDLEDADAQRKAYAANNYLYYMVAGEGRYSMEQMDAAEEELIAFESDPTLWQYRYDDTLAVYYGWLGDKIFQDRWHYLDGALKRIDRALAGCSDADEDVLKHKEKILKLRRKISS